MQRFLGDILCKKKISNAKLHVLDIGANIGFYTLFFANKLRTTDQIFVFEPAPTNLKHLQQEVVRLPNVTIFPVAVSDINTQMSLALSADSSIDHHLTLKNNSGSDTITVDVATIDGICKDLPSVDIIKMDIQGAECRALIGMKQLLHRSPQMIMVMELWPWGFSRMGNSWQDFKGILEDQNLTVRGMDGEDIWAFCNKNAVDPQKYINVIITHKVKATQ